MNDRDLCEACDLHHAAKIPGSNNVGIDAGDMCSLALAKSAGDIWLQEIVGAGGTATEMPLRHVEHIEAHPRQKRPWLTGYPLTVLQ